MNGAEVILKTLAANGVGACFANPGTSEMAFVDAAARVPELPIVLTLFEGVASGAADGYARISGKPASTLLHLGPGYANAMANLHNARRARSPIVNIVGDHATAHLALNAPLTSKLSEIADAYSVWSLNCAPHRISADTALAVTEAVERQGPTTLIVPGDVAWAESAPTVSCSNPRSRRKIAQDTIAAAARKVHSAGKKALLVLGSNALSIEGLAAAAGIAQITHAQLSCATFNARMPRGRGRPFLPKVPYFAEQAAAFFAPYEYIVLIGVDYPVSFFAYPGKPSLLPPNPEAVIDLASPADDAEAALLALAAALDAKPITQSAAVEAIEPGAGPLTAETAARSIARHLPENAIISDESATSGTPLVPLILNMAPHETMDLMGGSIGQGLPVATGAAVAAKDRKVVCLSGDGGAMYTIQALWTQARENLDVVTVIYANRAYRILSIEYQRILGQAPPAHSRALLEIGRPNLDFVALAKGMGIGAERADTAERFDDLFASAMKRRGPFLIEACLES
jgi:acetolactate synthase-1/2/3 large subunit